MADEFGSLLTKYRKDARLSQNQLLERFRQARYEGRYSKSDISKWEHGRIPPEEIVEGLEEILSAPKGWLLREAGYLSAGEYKRLAAGEGKDTELKTLQWQQVEHIRGLQEFAKPVIKSCPTFYPGFDSPKETELFHNAYFSLHELFHKLIRHAYWPSLAAHLSDGGQKIERMAASLMIKYILSASLAWHL